MRNSDLIAFFKPVVTQFSSPGVVEFLDFSGGTSAIDANPHRLTIRAHLSEGLYRGRLETSRGAFDMSTAMIDMVRVPDGKRVPLGPWDLDHLHNVMAIPMARFYVNGKLKGGLWFAMPGPEQIAESRLAAEFGFEAQSGENEIVLELAERDRERMGWDRLKFLELRNDDRHLFPLVPAAPEKPSIFLHERDIEAVRRRWQGTEAFEMLCAQLRDQELALLTDNSQGTLELACLVYALTGDATIGGRARSRIMELANAPTWSGRPDPLLMGGDNDRVISLRLYHTALAWDYLQPLFDEADRRAILAKAEEYIGKIYDFTLLQRGYMGCPAIDPHSLGAWNGAGIACMTFYHDLAVARHALPLFHGLFVDSLKLFPASGKAAWATYFPFHLVLYLAAAHTFGGFCPELANSSFLDHLGSALLASFEVPNSQELQRGLRTREHRFLSAFLCRFHPGPDSDAIYRAFAAREKKAAGNVTLGLFDLLYAPAADGPAASFPNRPLLAKDVGDLIVPMRDVRGMAFSLNAGPKAGRRAMFHLTPHNREFAPSMGAFEIAVDGTPVLCNINMGQYGIDSALTNTMCFEQGGALTNGQYLNGDVPPESGAILRRCFVGDRFVYAHVVLTCALDPRLEIEHADRVLIVDRKTGVVLISDAFRSRRPLRFATHLHCSGSVTDLGDARYRLTGGQANLIAGIKGGGKGLDDAEHGEVYAEVLRTDPAAHVVVEEPAWIPGYIYGLNNTGREEMKDGKFPRYRRWRLETPGKVTQAWLLFAVSPASGQAVFSNGVVVLPHGGAVRLEPGKTTALGAKCECECLIADEEGRYILAIGARTLRLGEAEIAFAAPVDLTCDVDRGEGNVYADADATPLEQRGFHLTSWRSVGEQGWNTLHTRMADISTNAPATKYSENYS